MNSDSLQNLKYLSRCYYYGKLQNWEYVEGAMVLIFLTYTATEFYGGNNIIRIYVPTVLENDLNRELIVGDMYFIIAAPYKICFKKTYKYRVDMLLNIFSEVI